MASSAGLLSYEKFNSLVANYAQASYVLSPATLALLLSTSINLVPKIFYHDDGDELTPAEIDEIEEIIANAHKELILGQTLNTITIEAPFLLYEETLAIDDGFIVQLHTIPEYAGCTAIEIQAHVRALATGGAALVNLFLNFDGTLANYDNSRIVNFTSLSGQNNAGSAAIGATPSSSQTANLFSNLHIRIPLPHSAHLKSATNLQASTQNTTNAQIEVDGLTWNSTAAITGFQLSANYSPEISFLAGSWIKVIGYKEQIIYVP